VKKTTVGRICAFLLVFFWHFPREKRIAFEFRRESFGVMKYALLAILFIAYDAFAQKCHTSPNASNYGTALTVCEMDNGSSVKCAMDGYGQTQCQINHANGVSSEASGGGAAIISLMVTPIVEHSAHKSDKYLRAAANFDLQTFVILADMASFFKRAGVEQRATELDRQAKGFAENARSTYEFQPGDLAIFYENRKLWKKRYELSLQGACTAREQANVLTRELSARLSITETPEWVKPAMDNIQNEAAALDADCNSKEASKLLRKQSLATRE
jgi:hypothetical protein